MRIFRKLLPHAGIILALMFITFFISKALLLLFALVSIANSCFVIHQNRKQFRARQERETRRDGRTEE